MSAHHETMAEPEQTEELFVAFANTLRHERGEPVDDVGEVDTLLAWLREHELLSSRGLAAEAGKLRRDPREALRRQARFRRLRDVLQAVAEDVSAGHRPSPQHLRELNHILRHGLHFHQLRIGRDGSAYTVAQVGDRLDQARASIASSLAHFLAGPDGSRLRVCANEACGDVFVDHSPTGRRRWCDMRTCGNQAKVARHRARLRGSAASGVPGSAASV
jgi:predicted RNA-binding Zn ribbon-like protein